MLNQSPIVAKYKPLADVAESTVPSASLEPTKAPSRSPWALAFLAVALLAGSISFVLRPAEVGAEPAHDDQIIRLYITTLGRTPDADGLAYWSERRENGEGLDDLARIMIQLPEAQRVSSGDFVVDAYRNALGRDPEPAGHEFWSGFEDPAQAIAAIADSEEHILRTGTLPPPVDLSSVVSPSAAITEPPTVVPDGWVDAGHGVFVPPILLEIRFCESSDDYTAANRRSSARGAYQFLASSWRAYGHDERYGVSTADQAAPAQQDEAALLTWERDGTRPWYASRHCWG